MGTTEAFEQIPRGNEIEQRWPGLEERCIAMTGKSLLLLDREETMRVVNLFSADDRSFAVRYLEHFLAASKESKSSPAPEKQRLRKRQPAEERMTLAEAFTINDDDKDEERAIRAAGMLLEWAAEYGNEEVDGFLVLGISRTLSLAADRVANTVRRLPKEVE